MAATSETRSVDSSRVAVRSGRGTRPLRLAAVALAVLLLLAAFDFGTLWLEFSGQASVLVPDIDSGATFVSARPVGYLPGNASFRVVERRPDGSLAARGVTVYRSWTGSVGYRYMDRVDPLPR